MALITSRDRLLQAGLGGFDVDFHHWRSLQPARSGHQPR
jgi:hypothetical protein